MSEQFDPYYLWLGIPPEESAGGAPNHYRLLGLRLFEPNREVISYAVDQRSTHLRSFQSGKRGAESQRLLNEVAAAGVCLLDDDKKRAYDRKLLTNLKLPSLGSAAQAIERLHERQELEDASPQESSSAPQAITIDAPEVIDSPEVADSPETSEPPSIETEWQEDAPAPAGSPKLALTVGAAAGALALLSIAAVVVGLVASARDPEVPEPPPGPRFAAGAHHATPSARDSGTPETSPLKTNPVAANPVGPSAGAEHGETNPNVSFANPPILPPTSSPAVTQSTGQSTLPATTNPPATVEAAPIYGGRSHAAVFRGRETLQIPIPDELRTKPADFTIEAWIRCYGARRGGTVISGPANDFFLLRSLDWSDSRGAKLQFAIGQSSLTSIEPTSRWMHVAIVRDGRVLRWFSNGVFQPESLLPQGFILSYDHLVFGDATNGFCGLVRDVRISRGVRYRGSFTPPARFAIDANTLVLPRLEAVTGSSLTDESGHGYAATISGVRWLPLTEDGQLAAENPDGTVDLLKAFALETDRLEGNPAHNKDWLDTQTATGNCRIVVPYPAPAEFNLKATFIRTRTTGGPILGLSIGGRPAVVALNAFPHIGDRTGILPSSMRIANTSPKMQGQPLRYVAGEPTTVEVKVRLQGSTHYNVEIWQDGKRLADLVGLLSELGAPLSELTWPADGCFMVGSVNCPIRFTELSLTTVTADLPDGIQLVKSEPAEIPVPPIPATTPPIPTPAGTPKVKPAPPSGKRSMPSAEELATQTEEARKLYEADLRKATKAEEKKSLADQIHRAGQLETDDDAVRYVLHELARKLYVQAGDLTLIISISQTIEEEYGIPRGTVLLASLQALEDVSLSRTDRMQVAHAATSLADRLFADNAYEQARQAAEVAQKSANRLSDPLLRKTTGEQLANFARIADAFAAVRPHLDTLATSPTDKAANLAAGKFYCLVLEDWTGGLAHLEASGSPTFAGPARLDVATRAAGATAVDRLKAGETWLQVAAASSAGDREDRRAIQRRSKSLLEAAVPNLSGLEKIRAEKKLQSLPDLGPPRRTSGGATPATTAVEELEGPRLIGSISRNDVDVGVLVQYQLGYRLTTEDVNQLAQAAARVAGVGQTMSLSLYGEMSLPVREQITFSVFGDATFGGANAVIVDDEIAVSIGGGRSNDNVRSMWLTGGKHTVRWVISGPYIPPRSSLEIAPSRPDAGGAAPAWLVAPDPQREATLLEERADRILTLGKLP
jgi:hypothetical protein